MTELREYIERLTGNDEADRIYAAEDIGYANLAGGVQPLLDRLPAEPSRAVREAIFAALTKIEDDAVIEGSLELLDSQDSFLRNQAVEILRARGAKAVPYLDTAFRDGNNDRRKFVIDVLAKLGDDEAFGIYDRALSDTDLNVVITVVESLGATRKAEFRERIESLVAATAHPMLLCACIEALAEIGDAGSVEAVRQGLGGKIPMLGYLQPSYLKLLGAKGTHEDVVEIAGLIGGTGLEGHVLNALTALRSRFHDLDLPVSLVQPLEKLATCGTSPLFTYQAVRLLAGFLHVEEVFDLVIRCLEHPDATVRLGAVQAMREAGSTRSEAILLGRLGRETDEEVLQALTR